MTKNKLFEFLKNLSEFISVWVFIAAIWLTMKGIYSYINEVAIARQKETEFNQRTKKPCNNKVVEIDGIKYRLTVMED